MLKGQARFISNIFTAQRVVYLGVLMIDASLLFVPYYFWSGEKFGVYTMSQLALMFAGILCVVEGSRMKKDES